jgi:hypothetical protein
MTIFKELISCSGAAAPRHPRDLVVMHGGGGGHGAHGGHGGGWGAGDWGGGGCGGGGNWASKIVLALIVAYIVLTGLGVVGH